MPYWVYIQRSGVWVLAKSFQHQNAAWLWIEKQKELWRSQGMPVPAYRVMYGEQVVVANQNG